MILDRIAEGELLTDICDPPEQPHRRTIYGWMDQWPEFSHAYARAKASQADAVAEKAVKAAINATAETAHAARVKFDGYKWWAAKLNPRVYSDKVDVNHTGSITLESLVTSAVQVALPKPSPLTIDSDPQE
jgi:hypothetical protein